MNGTLVKTLKSSLEPPQQRAIHKLALRNRRRQRGESLIDLATELRHLVTRAFSDKKTTATEEELDQFILALDSRGLRLSDNETSPKTLKKALQKTIKLETQFALEQEKWQEM